MSDGLRERLTPTPEIVELHNLIEAAENAARYFGGRAYRSGISDIAEASYAVGNTFDTPPNKTCIHFMAERFRDEPGMPPEVHRFWLHFTNEQTLYESQIPFILQFEIDGMLGERDPSDPPTVIQRVINMRYLFDDDGNFETFHDTFYRVDDQLGDAFKVHVDGEGIINISDEFGDVWEDLGNYSDAEDSDEYTDITPGFVALQQTDNVTPTETAADFDITDDVFTYMTESLVLTHEDLRMARFLVKCVRGRDIPEFMQRSLGIKL